MKVLDNILDFNDFYDRYVNEWKAGVITEKSIDDLFTLLGSLEVEFFISRKVSYNIECIIGYLLRYKYCKNQSVNWIEPIRNNNWELNSWINVDPKIVEYGCSIDFIEDYIRVALNRIFGYEHVKDHISEEEKQSILKEFSIENLANIDFIEDYLEKYARSNKVKRYLQTKGIYYGRRFII